jgi:hypothetical protein
MGVGFASLLVVLRFASRPQLFIVQPGHFLSLPSFYELALSFSNFVLVIVLWRFHQPKSILKASWLAGRKRKTEQSYDYSQLGRVALVAHHLSVG